MVRPGGVEKIAGEQRVDVESLQRDAMAAEDESGLLQVVAGLRQAGVGERFRQRAEQRLAPQAGVRFQRPVSERHVAGVIGPGRECDADHVGAHRVRLAGHHRDADPPGAPDGVEQLGEPLLGSHHAVVLLDRRRRRRVLGYQGPEAQRAEEREAELGRRAAVSQRVRLERDRDIGADGDQLAAPARVVRVLLQRRSLPLLLDVGRVLEQRVERSVRRDQLAGALLADAGDALHVVDRVAH